MIAVVNTGRRRITITDVGVEFPEPDGTVMCILANERAEPFELSEGQIAHRRLPWCSRFEIAKGLRLIATDATGRDWIGEWPGAPDEEMVG